MLEEDLPIDIHTGKLIDWLLSRRHIKKNWPVAVQLIREKINNAIQDMPEHPDITRLLSGSYINYFHCLQIIEILRDTEKESKNIFGWYTSQRMKDWQEIVRLYEADNVYLVEASQFLVRNVNYEIPSLKKHITKCRRLHEDCDNKIGESFKGSASAKEKYLAACKKIGITGNDPKQELLALLKELPETFRTIGEKVRHLRDARQYYEDYRKFIMSSDSSCLQLLEFIVEHGDVTVYEWKYGESPISIDVDNDNFGLAKDDNEDIEVVGSEEIDFGPVDGGELNDAGLSLDSVELSSVELETGDIDWGRFDSTQNSDQTDQIDCVEIKAGECLEIEVEASGTEGGIARGPEAMTLLFSETTRNQLINELLELEGFLSHRKVEVEAEENIVSMSLFSEAPGRLQSQDAEVIGRHLRVLTDVLHDLSSTKMQHLYLICLSPRYVVRLVDKLKSHLRDGDKLMSAVEQYEKRREDSLQDESKLAQQLNVIVSRTKELQRNIEHEISKKYKNRTVNLMGGIQQI